MRIISGKFKGFSLHMAMNRNTRPLKDRVRESVFNLLTHSKKISFNFEESIILDLFSGTGSFGLECISRQAKSVFFIENEKNAISILEKNIEKLKIKNKVKIFLQDVRDYVKKQKNSKNKFNLIFCDPPFKMENINNLIELIFYNKLLKKNGIIILHRSKDSNDKFPYFFEIIEERIYGISKIIFGKILF